ncbi:MAG: hypothetical protein L3J23_09035 [Flavobacteriaceae bacterium]|nr:hypothetical protein [Flavobacteriaceae bacterium]
MKRFQDCNQLEQLFRYRWYLLIPFKFGFRMLKPFKIYEDKIINNKLIHTDNFEIPKGKLLWRFTCQ